MLGVGYKVKHHLCLQKIVKQNFKYHGIWQMSIRLTCNSMDEDNGEVGFTYFKDGVDPHEVSVIFSGRGLRKMWMIKGFLGNDNSYLKFHHEPFRGSFKYEVSILQSFSNASTTHFLEPLPCDHESPSVEIMNKLRDLVCTPSESWHYYNILEYNGVSGPRPFGANLKPSDSLKVFSERCSMCEGEQLSGKNKCDSCMESWTYTCLLKCGHIVCRTCLDHRIVYRGKRNCFFCKIPFRGYNGVGYIKSNPIVQTINIDDIEKNISVPAKRVRRMFTEAQVVTAELQYLLANKTDDEIELIIRRYCGEKLY